MFSWIKYMLMAAAAVIAGGFLLLGGNLGSYMRTSARSVQQTVQDSVPLGFELRRARDLIDEILPDMQSQVRMIAQEEVAIAALEKEIAASSERLFDEKETLAMLRDKMRVQQVSYSIGERDLTRRQMTAQMHQRFQRFKQGELALETKVQLLEKRKIGLSAALAMLDKMRHRKVELEQKVEMLAAQGRILKASEAQSGIAIDGSRLSEADELLSEIETRLNIAQRVLAHEQDAFAINIEIVDDEVSEDRVLAEYDSHFGSDPSGFELTAK